MAPGAVGTVFDMTSGVAPQGGGNVAGRVADDAGSKADQRNDDPIECATASTPG
jgi:hypothetical protein